ncbi:hypothetical protein [Leifsonia shinshuensis]|uniref:hypothetical protein n=1 Tax=Leifsonia shinshuensis TaxID=150026 RepID=UPI00286774D9|nr:hypothetical protein [Leifsonia shinshuensis]MDR6971073.1 hypothetical protein [Leifsonia shinshuensis]
MNNWPDGALTREDVSEFLDETTRWHVEWCAGSGRAATEGRGVSLPDGVLNGVPTRAKRRKFERGAHDHRTWFFAFVGQDGSLTFHEGP